MTDIPPPTCTCSTVYGTRTEHSMTITTRVHAETCPVAVFILEHNTKAPNVKRVGPS